MTNSLNAPIWELYPQLKKLAEDWLDPQEQAELLVVLRSGIYINDINTLSSAFFWDHSPQGDAYWRDIANRIYAGNKSGYCESISEEPIDWQPDEAKPDIMDLTRGMF